MLKRLNDVTYQVKMNEKKMMIIHYEFLKPCEAQDVTQWVPIVRENFVKKQQLLESG